MDRRKFITTSGAGAAAAAATVLTNGPLGSTPGRGAGTAARGRAEAAALEARLEL